ncbi:MAG: Bax inhibitor-1/YccA family protein, partial [Candidatus Omnitrophota bacterium]
MMRTANPALTANTFMGTAVTSKDQAMTVQGTVNKAALSLLILFLAASWVWGKFLSGAGIPAVVGLGVIGGFVVALVTVFKKEWAPVTTPLYA